MNTEQEILISIMLLILYNRRYSFYRRMAKLVPRFTEAATGGVL